MYTVISAEDRYVDVTVNHGSTAFLNKPLCGQNLESRWVCKAMSSKEIYIQTYGGLQVSVDGENIKFDKKEKEFFALLVTAYGNCVTSVQEYEIIRKNRGLNFNSEIFGSLVRRLSSTLEKHGIESLLCVGLTPIRSCCINTGIIACDYYSAIQDGTAENRKNEFLPEYEWSSALYSTTKESIDALWMAEKV